MDATAFAALLTAGGTALSQVVTAVKHGGWQQKVKDLREDLEDIESRLERIETRTKRIRDEGQDQNYRSRQSSCSGADDVIDIRETVNMMQADIAELRSQVALARAANEQLQAVVTAVSKELREYIPRLERELGGIGARIESILSRRNRTSHV